MLTITVLPSLLGIAKLDASTAIPDWALQDKAFFSITKTADELSIVCLEDRIPSHVKTEKGWNAIKVEGPLDFGLTGILSSLLHPLAEAKISIFALSTFDTDYVLFKKENLHRVIEILEKFCKVNKP